MNPSTTPTSPQMNGLKTYLFGGNMIPNMATLHKTDQLDKFGNPMFAAEQMKNRGKIYNTLVGQNPFEVVMNAGRYAGAAAQGYAAERAKHEQERAQRQFELEQRKAQQKLEAQQRQEANAQRYVEQRTTNESSDVIKIGNDYYEKISTDDVKKKRSDAIKKTAIDASKEGVKKGYESYQKLQAIDRYNAANEGFGDTVNNFTHKTLPNVGRAAVDAGKGIADFGMTQALAMGSTLAAGQLGKLAAKAQNFRENRQFNKQAKAIEAAGKLQEKQRDLDMKYQKDSAALQNKAQSI